MSKSISNTYQYHCQEVWQICYKFMTTHIIWRAELLLSKNMNLEKNWNPQMLILCYLITAKKTRWHMWCAWLGLNRHHHFLKSAGTCNGNITKCPAKFFCENQCNLEKNCNNITVLKMFFCWNENFIAVFKMKVHMTHIRRSRFVKGAV